MERIACLVIRWGSRVIVARRLDVTLDGLPLMPRTGPVILVCRHYHHFYDGCILLSALPRPVHILVGLDWVRGRWLRRVMEWCCGLARWPVVVRRDGPLLQRGQSAYRATESGRYLRRALRDATRLLRAGHVVVVFPEAYPNVDPDGTPKCGEDAYLPFRPGYLRLAELAERAPRGPAGPRRHTPEPVRARTRARTRVALVPTGLSYRPGRRWRVTVRVGPPLYLDAWPDRAILARHVEEEVHRLSDHVPDCRPAASV